MAEMIMDGTGSGNLVRVNSAGEMLVQTTIGSITAEVILEDFYSTYIDYSGTTNPIYIGRADPGTNTASETGVNLLLVTTRESLKEY